MPNRHVRDQLIKIALDMAQLPNLTVHDMPNGVVQPDAYSIQWLQDILDFWYHMVPFSSTVQSATLNCTANSNLVTLPSDFILDVRNGYLVQRIPNNNTSFSRAGRIPFQKSLNRQISFQSTTGVNYPFYYCVNGHTSTGLQTMIVTPTPNIATQGMMWYYSLPASLEAGDKPLFPNDYVCVEYLRIRALEFGRVYEVGTAQKFTEKIVGGMKAAGLMNEPEDDEIPFDTMVYHRMPQQGFPNSYAWLGPQ